MKNAELRELLQQHTPEHIIETLSPFILDNRKQRIESVINDRIEHITIAIEQPSDMHNALAVIRSAEAFGLSAIHIIAPEHEATSIRSLTQGTVYWIQTHYYDRLTDFIECIQSENKQLIGAVVDAQTAIKTVPTSQPICLLFGNEARGLSDTARSHCNGFFTIPMHGMAESLNLSVSAAVSIYDITNRQRHNANQQPLLSEETKTALRAQYYLNSVKPRTIMQLLR